MNQIETVPPEQPEDFDLKAWIAGAKRPTRRVTLYQRGDLLADLDRIEQEMAVRDEIPAEYRSVAEDNDPLVQERDRILVELDKTKLVVLVGALTKDEIREVEDAYPLPDIEPYMRVQDGERTLDVIAYRKACEPAEQQRGRALLAKAIVSPQMTAEDVADLEEAVGTAQVTMLTNAWRQATEGFQEVGAPFSRRSSTRGAGTTS